MPTTPRHQIAIFAIKAAIVLVPLLILAPDIARQVSRAAALAWYEGKVTVYADPYVERGADPAKARLVAGGLVLQGN
jgi:hypothetical protein